RGRCGRGTFNSRCRGTRCTVASLNGWRRCSPRDSRTRYGGVWRRAWPRTRRGSTGEGNARRPRCRRGGSRRARLGAPSRSRVLAAGVPPDAPGLDGVGYREAAAMLAGRLPERELRDAIVVATRRYAKRQETWFRNQLRQPGDGRREAGYVWTLDATESPRALAA